MIIKSVVGGSSRFCAVAFVLLLLVSLGLSGCDPSLGAQHRDGSASSLLGELDGDFPHSQATVYGILALLNDADVDVDFLDVACDIDLRAAERLVAHRRGPDDVDGNWDDDPFDDLPEVDDVAYVGPAALDNLADMAHELGLVPIVLIEGVPFNRDDAEATLLLVNDAPAAVLDEEANIDARAVVAIVGGRPYADLAAVADQPWVGPSTLEALRDFAGPWIETEQ